MFYSNQILPYLIFYNVYKSLYEEKLIFEGTSTQYEVNVCRMMSSLPFFPLLETFHKYIVFCFLCKYHVFFSILYIGMYFNCSGRL